MLKNIKYEEVNTIEFIVCLQGKHKAKVFNKGDTMETLIMAVAICKTVVDKMAVEKGLSTEAALKFIVESICEGYGSLN